MLVQRLITLLINNPLGEYNKHVSTETYNTLINNPLGEYNLYLLL